MQFFWPQAFLLLWVVPMVIALFWISQQLWRKRLEKLGNFELLKSKLMPQYRPAEYKIRAFYLLLAILLAITALARPQWGEEKRKIQRKGVDVLFLLDTSLSMMAEDAVPNRFEKSKLSIKNFVRRLKGDRVGLIAFAGSSFMQAPLTLDYSTFFLFLDAMQVGYIPDPGTSLAEAIRYCIRSFPENSLKYKAVVVFTDGEDHEGGIDEALAQATKAGLRIYTVGVGTPEGVPIPLKDESGRQSGFKKNRAGEIVITKLNRPLLEKVASQTGGIYLPSTPSEQEIDVILKHMESLGKRQFKEKLVSEKGDHFQILLFFSLLFLCLEMLVRRTQKILPTAFAAILIFFLFNGFFDSPDGLNNKANKSYREKKYQSALKLYQNAEIGNPNDPTIRYNLGTADYQVQSYQEAAKELEKSVNESKDPKLRARAYYNYGNTEYRLGNFEKAIEFYQKTLEIDPSDKDAKYNLEFLQKQKNLFEKKNQERKKNQNQQQQKQQQQNQQQQNQQQSQQNSQRNQQQNHRQQNQQKNQQQNQNQNQQEKEGQEQQQGQQQKSEPQQQNPQAGQEQDQQEQQRPQQEQKEQPKPEAGQEEPKKQEADEEKQGQQVPQPLQGQMTMGNALQILDALREGEKELQDLRRPKPPKNEPQVDKDW